MNDLEFTILMPCLNEEKTVAACVEKAAGWLKRSGYTGEVLIVDNGSTDASAENARAAGARVVSEQRRGYGSALIRGIREARGKYIIMGDCDCSYDFSNLDPFADKLHEGYDLVMGNRFKGGIAKGAMPFSHKIGAPCLSFVAKVRYGVPVNDFHSGLRAFDTAMARTLRLRCPGREFATELVARFKKAGARMCEVPITLSPDGRDGKPHLNTIRDGFRHLHFILSPLDK